MNTPNLLTMEVGGEHAIFIDEHACYDTSESYELVAKEEVVVVSGTITVSF